MFSRLPGLATVFLAILVAAIFLTSCDRETAQSQISPPSIPSSPQPTSGGSNVGRFQIVVVGTSNQTSMVMMLDTAEGASWIYRMPQGNAVNGFWSDIPRLTYDPEFWRQVFAQQQQSPAAPTNAPANRPK